MKKFRLSPSIFAADIVDLRRQLDILKENKVDLIHVDVMDGTFVSHIAYGADHIKMIKAYTDIPLDVHLMVSHPERHLDAILEAGADIITVHQESTDCLYHCLQKIRKENRQCGVVLSPATNPISIEYVLTLINMILVMTVNPGEGSQKFMPEMLRKISTIKNMIKGKNIDIEVDGSIDDKTITLCKEAGADVFVSGGYIFKGDIKNNIASLRKGLDK